MMYNTFVDKNNVLISAGILFREAPGGGKFLIVKEPESDKWEFIKLLVRKGESSVRAVIRIMGEKGAMSVRVIEEAGRYKSAVTTNGKPVTQLNMYYVMILKSDPKNADAFGEVVWLDYAKATKKLGSKKEAAMLKSARDIIKEWQKKRKKGTISNEEDEEQQEGQEF